MIITINNINTLKSLEGCILTYGHFTTIHPGHIRYLKNANRKGKKLIVALMGDEINSNTNQFEFNQKDRSISLSMLEIVDDFV